MLRKKRNTLHIIVVTYIKGLGATCAVLIEFVSYSLIIINHSCGSKVASFSYKQIFRIYFFRIRQKNGYYYSDALYFPIEPDVSSIPPQCLLNESSSLLIAFVYPSLTNASAKILLLTPFLEALKTENFESFGVTVNTYKANLLYYTSICVR